MDLIQSISGDDDSVIVNTPILTKVKKRQDDVRRVPNPYIIWSKREREILRESGLFTTKADINFQLGNRWRNLSFEDREPYIKEAFRLRKEFLAQIPSEKVSQKVDSSKRVKKGHDVKSTETNSASNSAFQNSNSTAFQNSEAQIANDKTSLVKPSLADSDHKVSSLMHESAHVLKKRKHKKSDGTVSDSNSSNSKEKMNMLKNLLNSKQKEQIAESLKNTAASLNEDQDLPKPRRNFHIDGALTSGSICAIASNSKDECSETFDFLVDSLLRSCKDSDAEIEELAREYKLLVEEDLKTYKYDYEFPEGKIKMLPDVLGKHWRESECKFDLTLGLK